MVQIFDELTDEELVEFVRSLAIAVFALIILFHFLAAKPNDAAI
jgi:hypothetical protein